MTDAARVRAATVAGTFYPDDPRVLRADVDTLLDNARVTPVTGRPLLLVEPHAGYVYSGSVAAHGYRLIAGHDIRTAIVISPSHVEYFDHIAVYDGDAYETPLGRVAVNRDVVDAIARSHPLIRRSDHGHVRQRTRGEHALEVQLPFLQAVGPDCTIVPIVMGDQRWDRCVALGEALAPHLATPGTLIVASSDLSHFHPYDVARVKDAHFLDKLAALDARVLYDAVESRSCEACGAGPVIAGLIAASTLGPLTFRLLSAANSGDVTGDRSQVVGYASAVLLAGDDARSVRESEVDDVALSGDDRRHLLARARCSIAVALGLPGFELPPPEEPQRLEAVRGGFITLKRGRRLRGCIGTIEGREPLAAMVDEMAQAAAFNDPRFPGLRADELPDVHIEISILSPLKRATVPAEVEVGTHGLVIERGGQRGLLLPQVAAEQRWDAVTFLEHTCEKAGLPANAWTDDGTRVYTFTATVFSEDN